MTAPAAVVRSQGRGPRLVALDGYRALAAVGVLATHAGFMTGASADGPLAPLLSRLDVGVAIFFVLSGFLLFAPEVERWLDGSPLPSVPVYLWHRAVRILPLYWMTLVLAALAVRREESWTPRQTLVQALLLQSWWPDEQALGLTQMWSLSTEVAFYLLLPVLAAILLRPGRRPSMVMAALVALGVLSLAYRITAAGGHGPLVEEASLQLPANLDWFVGGMVLALLAGSRARHVTAPGSRLAGTLAMMPGWCVAAALSLLAIACTPVGGPRQLTAPTGFENVVKHLLYLGVAVLLVLPVVLGRVSWLERALATPTLVRLGALSYGVFCLHLIVLEVLYDVAGLQLFTGGVWYVFPSALALTVCLAWVAQHLIERPSARLRSRRPPAGTAAAAHLAQRPPNPAATGRADS